MHTTNLRKVGGSIMLAVPPALLDILHLQAGTTVGITLEGERLVIESRLKPRYTVEQLLEESNDSNPRTPEEQEWLDSPPLGRELL